MKKALHATIDQDLLAKIKKLAKEQNRTVSNLVETLLYEVTENK